MSVARWCVGACAVLVAACAATHAPPAMTSGPMNSGPVASAPATPAPAPTQAAAAPIPDGQRLYARHCLSCHQADGRGVPNMQPAIAGGSWVTGDARALALFVITGGFDSASRKDGGEGNVMPPFDQLPDADLAGILTYVRNKFGKGASAVSAADVAAARATLPDR